MKYFKYYLINSLYSPGQLYSLISTPYIAAMQNDSWSISNKVRRLFVQLNWVTQIAFLGSMWFVLQ